MPQARDICFVETEWWTEPSQAGVIEGFPVTFFEFLDIPEPHT